MDNKNEVIEMIRDVAEGFRFIADNLQEICKLVSNDSEEKQPEVTLEQVRGVLADKSRAGFTEQVREIIKRYGADRLSDVKPEDFPALLKDAEGIGNE